MFTFAVSGAHCRSAQVLLLLVLPGQLIFVHIIHVIKGGLTLPSLLFTVLFLSASLIQVSGTWRGIPHQVVLLMLWSLCPASFSQVFLLLIVADCLVHCLWRRGKDPDSYSIPYLTALGDLLGTALLSLAFLLLWCIGDSWSEWITDNNQTMTSAGKDIEQQNILKTHRGEREFKKTKCQKNG